MGLVAIRPLVGAGGLSQALSTQIRVIGQHGDGPLRLPRHARHLEVELTAIALAEPENVQFRYRFSSDQEWMEVGHRRKLNFRDLKPGRHTLEVSSRYVNSEWSGLPQRLHFSAAYRLHEHPAFHALLVIASLLLSFGIWQVGRVRQRLLEEEVRDRSQRLSVATDRLASLSEAIQKRDIQHRTALQAVSRELRSALTLAMAPLLQPSSRAKKTRHREAMMARTRTLEAMLDQIGSFIDAEPDQPDPGAQVRTDEGSLRVEQGALSATRAKAALT
ncbi:MAG: hypothetical protein JJU31_16230 [Wenzhouxiangella sp.]|nr:hypothetical protein [Wenzhouxiangella sp.]MCH8478402.1 hypothetical protein [Wenzhouxiangella sp.]